MRDDNGLTGNEISLPRLRPMYNFRDSSKFLMVIGPELKLLRLN